MLHGMCEQEIVDAGALPPLVALLDRSAEVGAQAAAGASANLAAGDSVLRAMVTAAEPLPKLKRLVFSANEAEVLAAIVAMSSLAEGSNHDVKQEIVPRAVELLFHSNAYIVAISVELLNNVAHDSDDHRRAVNAAGAIPHLTCLLSSSDSFARMSAVDALHEFAQMADMREQIIEAGAVQLLVRMLDCMGLEAQSAAGILKSLAATSGVHKQAIVEAGAIVPLVQLYKGSDREAVEVACWRSWSWQQALVHGGRL